MREPRDELTRARVVDRDRRRAVRGEQAIVAEGEPGGAGRLRAPGLALVGGVPGGQATVSGGDERVLPKREVLDRGGVPKSRALLSVRHPEADRPVRPAGRDQPRVQAEGRGCDSAGMPGPRPHAPRSRVEDDHVATLARRHCGAAVRAVRRRRGGRVADANDPLDARVDERRPQHVLGRRSRIQPRGVEREGQAPVRIRHKVGGSRRDQLARTSLLLGILRLAPLREGVDGDQGHRNEPEQEGDRDSGQPAVPPLGTAPRSLHLLLAPPSEHGFGEDVVEDLVACAAPVAVDRADDAFPPEGRQHGSEQLLVDGRVLGEVVDAVGDLRARGRDEVAKDVGRDVPLLVRQLLNGAAQVRPNDRFRTTQLGERLGAEDVRARLGLLLPDALEDELEVRRFDAPLLFLARTEPATGVAKVDLARSGLVENGHYQLRLDLDAAPGRLAVALDRVHYRCPQRPVDRDGRAARSWRRGWGYEL